MAKGKMLTTNDLMERYNAAYTTVIGWIKSSKIKAIKETYPRGDVWLIPESALKSFDPGRKGRPKKTKGATK